MLSHKRKWQSQGENFAICQGSEHSVDSPKLRAQPGGQAELP